MMVIGIAKTLPKFPFSLAVRDPGYTISCYVH